MATTTASRSSGPHGGESDRNVETDRNVEAGGVAGRECTHCGLSTRRPADPSGLVFCCHGCRGAYELIQGWGLSDYYSLRTEASGDGPWEPESDRYEDLDDPRLLGRSAPVAVRADDGRSLLKSTLSADGLHCAACVWLLERAPERVPGWHSSLVNYHLRTIDVVFDPAKTRLSDVARWVAKLGYRLSPVSASPVSGQDQDASRNESHAMLVDLAVAGFCAANAMWVAVALYAGSSSGMASGHEQILRVAGVLLGCIAVIFPGRVFFRSAIAAVRTRTPHMDLPVALGLSAGLLASLYGLLDINHDVYFDSIACLVFFLLAGRWIQSRQQRRAGEEVAGLIRMAPVAVDRIGVDGQVARVPLEEVDVGDLVQIRPSDSVPVDGVITQGRSQIDRSLLTGESVPVEVGPGDHVEAGTDNIQSALTIRATAVGEDTRLASITAAVAGAAAARTPIVQLANRIGGWFVVVVLMLAVVTAVIWMRVDPSRMLPNVVALLIVACPCALALATPLAVAVAIGRLAKRKVLVRAGDCLERLSDRGTVFFDKTGTLTSGRMTLTHWIGDASVKRDVGIIEGGVRHPIAGAIRAAVSPSDSQGGSDTAEDAIDPVTEFLQVPGCGVEGCVDGRRYQIGNEKLVGEIREPSMRDAMATVLADGSSPVLVSLDGQVVAVLGVSDTIRDDAAMVIESLRRRGWRVGVLSGDDPAAVDAMADRLSLPPESALGGLLPEEKLAAVEAAKSTGGVVMVGDGLNDAAALAAADVGVALRGGASASLTAAPVMIGDGRLSGVVTLIDSAAATRHSMYRNFAVSISYNAVAVVLSMAGWINPLIAAVLMPISSLSVIAMTLSQRRVDRA